MTLNIVKILSWIYKILSWREDKSGKIAEIKEIPQILLLIAWKVRGIGKIYHCLESWINLQWPELTSTNLNTYLNLL